MRKILFRGKRIDNGEWIEGCCLDKNNMGIFFEDTEEEDCHIDIFSVFSNTIGEFTGLYDKNGVKIFEGDILKRDLKFDSDSFSILVVKFDAPKFEAYEIDGEEEFCIEFCNVDAELSEVIGNIYDNPELLDGNKNFEFETEGD